MATTDSSTNSATFTPPFSVDDAPLVASADTNMGTANFDATALGGAPPVTESTGPVPSGESAPTASHALATTDHDEKGIVQLNGQLNTDLEVKDLGWNEPAEKVPAPLIGGLSNEELWTLVRRFNKQIYQVKAIAEAPPGGLDLNVAAEDDFSPDKLRSNVERFYMTVVIGMAGFAKHIARLRSWNEKRTGWFCTVRLYPLFTNCWPFLTDIGFFYRAGLRLSGTSSYFDNHYAHHTSADTSNTLPACPAGLGRCIDGRN